MNRFKRLTYLLLLAGTSEVRAQGLTPLYLDEKQPIEQRVQDLISKMTTEEKAMFLDHRAPDIGRFNIRAD